MHFYLQSPCHLNFPSYVLFSCDSLVVSIFSITFIKFRFAVTSSKANALLVNYFECLYFVLLKGRTSPLLRPRKGGTTFQKTHPYNYTLRSLTGIFSLRELPKKSFKLRNYRRLQRLQNHRDYKITEINPRFLRSRCVKGSEESISRVDCSVPLMNHDPRDLGLICLIKKHKIRFSDSLGFKNPIGFS